MNISFKKYQKFIGKSKFLYCLGCFFLITGILVAIVNIFSVVSWNSKKINYTKEYVYSEYGTLYYESNGEKIYIENVYNTDDEKITIDIPNNQTIIMYINKENINEGIYFDLDNTIEQSMINPAYLLIPLFICAMGLYFVISYKEVKENKNTTNPLFLFFIDLFLVGSILIISQVYKGANYFKLKSHNNVTTATVYSQIYNKSGRGKSYKFVADYYVDGKKIYIC